MNHTTHPTSALPAKGKMLLFGGAALLLALSMTGATFLASAPYTEASTSTPTAEAVLPYPRTLAGKQNSFRHTLKTEKTKISAAISAGAAANSYSGTDPSLNSSANVVKTETETLNGYLKDLTIAPSKVSYPSFVRRDKTTTQVSRSTKAKVTAEIAKLTAAATGFNSTAAQQQQAADAAAQAAAAQAAAQPQAPQTSGTSSSQSPVTTGGSKLSARSSGGKTVQRGATRPGRRAAAPQRRAPAAPAAPARRAPSNGGGAVSGAGSSNDGWSQGSTYSNGQCIANCQYDHN